MISYQSFYNFLLKNKLITPIWKYILELIDNEIIDVSNKDYYLQIFSIYFSLINDGNICISLDKQVLKEKWLNKLKDNKILLSESTDFNESEFENITLYSLNIIDNYLDEIKEENLSSVIGNNKIFQIDEGYLYLKKYNVSRRGVIENIDKLYQVRRNIETNSSYEDFVNTKKITPSNGQMKAFVEGIKKNLIITGGPGTGKTTSILFLLINLLETFKDDLLVYLVAPSGKASSRMKESIINGLVNIKEEYKLRNPEIINKINNLEESTIHRLLEVDHETNGFLYNKYHQFPEKSLFVIDEASMIDVCLFNALLESIPENAFVYIMGDKNQLPSVECGSVFGDLLKKQSLQDNIVELDESIRFSKDTKIYELAWAINNGEELNIKDDDWKDPEEFIIEPDDKTKPVFFYNIDSNKLSNKEVIQFITKTWGEEYYQKLQDLSSNLNPNDYEYLNNLFKTTEISKILCAENRGIRGVLEINKFIKNTFIDKSKPTSINGYYPGMIMMINKNNKMLDLYNGDSGILVTFQDDNTLYFMVKKATNLVKVDGKLNDRIFKLNDFTFYPLRLISTDEIDLAYAITIHKSQGSDYKNILVILPNVLGHPLLNRQIIYTAITRTKGNTYILSNNDRLNESKNRIVIRDTNIV